MKIPNIAEDKLKINKNAFEYPNIENYNSLNKLPEINDFVSPSSIVYFVAKSNTDTLNKWYKKLFGSMIDIDAEVKKSKHDRTKDLDTGFVKHVVLYASLIKFLRQVQFDKARFISKLALTKSTTIAKVCRSFKYGDRSNVFNEFGKTDVLVKRRSKKPTNLEEKEKQWPDVLKAACEEGYPKKICEQYKDKFTLHNRGVFMMALANHDKKKNK